MWTVRSQTSENIELELSSFTARFEKRNVLCDYTGSSVTAGMVRAIRLGAAARVPLMFDTCLQKNVPGANGSPHTIILQGQWESAILKDESTWSLEDGKLVLDIRKRSEGNWKVALFRRAALLTLLSLTFLLARQIIIRSGINGDDSLIDPLSRVVLGYLAQESQNHALALQCFERSAQEGSWNAMRKLAALFESPPMNSRLMCMCDSLFQLSQVFTQ